jgi:hypothetical protein
MYVSDPLFALSPGEASSASHGARSIQSPGETASSPARGAGAPTPGAGRGAGAAGLFPLPQQEVESRSRAGPGGGQVEPPHRASDFGRAPSNIHIYIILGAESSTATPLVPLRRTVLTLR